MKQKEELKIITYHNGRVVFNLLERYFGEETLYANVTEERGTDRKRKEFIYLNSLKELKDGRNYKRLKLVKIIDYPIWDNEKKEFKFVKASVYNPDCDVYHNKGTSKIIMKEE